LHALTEYGRLASMNREWHEKHVLPRGAPLEQRITWHAAHQVACACRPIPAKLRAHMAGQTPTAASAPGKSGSAPVIEHPKFAKLVAELSKQPGVTFGGKGFGASALKLGGKIFAMLTPKGQLVAKLPKPRVAELVAAGKGEYFDPGHGRLMKEWLSVAATNTRWLELAKEAYAHARGA
jgi:hypothetical protein